MEKFLISTGFNDSYMTRKGIFEYLIPKCIKPKDLADISILNITSLISDSEDCRFLRWLLISSGVGYRGLLELNWTKGQKNYIFCFKLITCIWALIFSGNNEKVNQDILSIVKSCDMSESSNIRASIDFYINLMAKKANWEQILTNLKLEAINKSERKIRIESIRSLYIFALFFFSRYSSHIEWTMGITPSAINKLIKAVARTFHINIRFISGDNCEYYDGGQLGNVTAILKVNSSSQDEFKLLFPFNDFQYGSNLHISAFEFLPQYKNEENYILGRINYSKYLERFLQKPEKLQEGIYKVAIDSNRIITEPRGNLYTPTFIIRDNITFYKPFPSPALPLLKYTVMNE